MKYFKIVPKRNATRYEISTDSFEKATENKYPFEQKNPNGSFSQYGICPSCLNPIQLIGLYSTTATSQYGRHTGKDIDGLPEWSFAKYKYCPYAKNKPSPNDNERIEIDDAVIELYDLLKSQFDRVVYVISDELKIRCSGHFWEKALQQFLANKTYCYPWLTEANLPYLFAYRGLHHQDIWGQKFLENSELYNALKKHPNVKFEKATGGYMFLKQKRTFLKLQFRLTGHKQIAQSGESLRESMMLYVDDMVSDRTIFAKRIEFSETHFIRLIEKKGNEDKRQQWLLDISNRLMKPLNKNN